MQCACDKCAKRGTAKCDKERLKFDVQYISDLLKKAESKFISKANCDGERKSRETKTERNDTHDYTRNCV